MELHELLQITAENAWRCDAGNGVPVGRLLVKMRLFLRCVPIALWIWRGERLFK